MGVPASTRSVPPVLIHGDAPPSRARDVWECFWLPRAFAAANTGGCIHFINNQIGFTTSPHRTVEPLIRRMLRK
ncbi:MAG: hypothetical protein H6917_08085 [Novosphingobium sp.]|nr:hypothetical protein [Novosphingobium sp.]